ncbi:streptogrisin B precursor [Streptomyces sp. CNQ-509]|uniref:S1 family peptidase n=1 Tax=Streptomyces sp. CNQ-509 TaxID=444103 RepID=UPI00062E06E5|nr:S1 family peptidase [Streptomyces sp. CNQ-509]AKH84976.1 streptogrisin B precursor [Streptomyces sp. CNQ-509]
MNLRRAPLTPHAVPLRLTPAAAVLAAVLLAVLTALAPPAAGAQDQAVRGGDVLYSSTGPSCPVGFNAGRGGERYALMQGRCAAAAGPVWYADAARTVEVGRTEAVNFPGGDFALIRYTNPDFGYPSEVSAGIGVIGITGAAQPSVGRQVCHAGRTTGVHCGTVVSVNDTVSYPEGTVSGLFRSHVCVEPGDGAGPAWSGGTALGLIVSGGSCTSGGATFYQPVVPALQAYGLTLP